MRLNDLFGFSEIVVKCTSGEEMYEVANKAISELNATNHSSTVAGIIRDVHRRENMWQHSDFRWVLIRDYLADGIHMFGFNISDDTIYAFPDQIISVEEYFNAFGPQLTVDEQEFSDLFQELVS